VMDGMVRVAMAVAAEATDENRQWAADFCADYTARVLGLWED